MEAIIVDLNACLRKPVQVGLHVASDTTRRKHDTNGSGSTCIKNGNETNGRSRSVGQKMTGLASPFDPLCTIVVERRLQSDGGAAFEGSKSERWSLDEKYKRARFKTLARLEILQIISAWGSSDAELEGDSQAWHTDYAPSWAIKVQAPLASVENDKGPIEIAGDDFLEFANHICCLF